MTQSHKFANKWSPAIEKHGYVDVPNLLIKHRTQLKISVPEAYTLICILTFKWDEKNPWPSMAKIAIRTGVAPRTIRSHVESLEKQGYVKRIYRRSTSNKYSFGGLTRKLNQFAYSSLPPGGKEPPRSDDSLLYDRIKTSAKEESFDKMQHKRTKNKNGGLIEMGKLLKEHPLKSNDFDKKEDF